MKLNHFLIISALSICLYAGLAFFERKFFPVVVEDKYYLDQGQQISNLIIVVDSLRNARSQTITVIKKTLVHSKKEIPIIYDSDSLVNSINSILSK